MALTEEQKAKRREHYQKNKDVYKKKANEWKKANPEKAKESQRKARRQDRESAKTYELRYKYGLTWDDYAKLYDSQHGACAICRTPLALLSEGMGNKTANVDHNHTTGKVRGLLCNNCNRGIGHLQDSATILRLAAEYLDENNG